MTALADWLAGPEGAAAIAVAEALPAGDPVAAAGALRERLPGLAPDLASAALSQASLRRLAAERSGIAGDRLLLTRDGLEQATRPAVAAIRAGLIAAQRPARVVDATAGLGFDTRALADALLPLGVPVVAIERDPATARFLQVNVPGAEVRQGDAVDILDTLDPPLTADDLVYVDPARRDHRRSADGLRALPERDRERWSPPWSWVVSLAARTRVCAKVAPGFSPSEVPTGWCAQWASWQRTPVEAFACSWPALEGGRARRAIAVDRAAAIDGDGAVASPIEAVGAWLHEVDPAVAAAGLVDDLIARVPSMRRINHGATWLSGDVAAPTALVRSLRILEELPGDPKGMRSALRQRGVASVTLKTRGGRRDADAWRRELRLPAGPDATIVATDADGRPAAYLVESA